MVPNLSTLQKERRTLAACAVFEAVAELGESFYDEAMEMCDDERSAAFLASATLLSTLERERVFRTPTIGQVQRAA